ncbi:MAG: hypothetical protein CM15mP103_08980 [Gammaproteobacteria bacterium]|nr:MAG: hypothetical protein CM15mP103_08980 [Gammaproteobacteria bacterium]
MLGMAAVSVNQGTMTLGDFILVNQFMLQLFMPLGFLGFVYREIKGAMANIERLFGVLEQAPSLAPAPTDKTLSVTEGESGLPTWGLPSAGQPGVAGVQHDDCRG